MELIAEKEPMIRRAMTIEDVFTKNEEDRRLYELREKGRMDFQNAISTAEKRGENKGENKGEIKGAAKKSREIARSLLATAMSPESISEHTGLSVEEINALTRE